MDSKFLTGVAITVVGLLAYDWFVRPMLSRTA